MVFTPTPFNAGAAPGISAAELNKLGTQYGEAVNETASKVAAAQSVKLDDFAAPDDNTDLNASTTRHGLLPKFPNDANQFLRGDGSWGGVPMTMAYGASDILKNSNDVNCGWINSMTYIKAKEIRFNAAYVGIMRIKYDLKRGNGGSAFGKIYLNGAAIGTEQTTTLLTWTTYTEDLTVNIGVNGLLQIYAHHSAVSVYADVQNFRLYYSKKIVTLGSETLETPVLCLATAISTTNMS